MPTYQYVCKNCGHSLEELQSFKEEPLTKCPTCGKDTLARIMSQGSGFILKGTGFYKTDYIKGGDTKPSSDAKPDEKKKEGGASSTPSETKPATPTPPASDSKKE